MLPITKAEIAARLRFDNPWWDAAQDTGPPPEWRERVYLDGFLVLMKQRMANRAVVLMGPRRVGKTVMLTQAVYKLIADGVEGRRVCYVSVDNPIYTGLGLQQLLDLFMAEHGHRQSDRLYVIFDEIQYLRNWERHLKSLVDSYPHLRFVASGSAAAALAMKSRESGAGRFTEFLLPPLGFYEFMRFRHDDNAELLAEAVNDDFMAYINYGGFPEAVINVELRRSMDRFVANDVIDKVLLRDIPSLYGIGDPQELKRLFAVLAYNTGQEIELDGLSKSSQIAKNTIRKYLEYLEAAFLIRRVHRLDQSARRFQRATYFKVYLANPSIRAALFGEITADDPRMGALAETAFAAQLMHETLVEDMFYARWNKGEVDFVFLMPSSQKPLGAIEIKWSSRDLRSLLADTPGLVRFCVDHGLKSATILTRWSYDRVEREGVEVSALPLAILCNTMGKRLVQVLKTGSHPRSFDWFSKPASMSIPAPRLNKPTGHG